MITQAAADTMKLYEAGTLVMVVRSGILKRLLPLSFLSAPATINQDLKALELYDKSVAEYIYFVIKAFEPYILFELVKAVTTVDSLKFDEFQNLLIPFPPLEEQIRIVVSLLEIEAHIAAYDEAEQKLTTLNATFPDQLKKSILQAAVQGKLVPQDPHDEPASVLLDRIRAERERMIRGGKIKRGKDESVIFRRDNSHYEIRDGIERCIDDEIPFDIPDNWAWTRLGSIGQTNIGLTYNPSDVTTGKGIAVLRSNNIQDGKICYDNLLYVNLEVSDKLMAQQGDILICARNGSRALVGKSAIIDKNGMTFGAFMAIYRSIFNPYIQVFINSSLFRGQLEGANTTTINQVTQDMLKQSLCPLPPLSEQERIVERIGNLFSVAEIL